MEKPSCNFFKATKENEKTQVVIFSKQPKKAWKNQVVIFFKAIQRK